METEFENQDALGEVLMESTTGELPDTEGIQENFSQAAVALEHLNALTYTISREGVSQEDYRKVEEIITSLEAYGIHIAMGPALEDFSIGHFSKSRSLINQRVSQEGFGQTVVELIKRAIQALIDYLVKGVRWVRNYNHRDEAIQRKIESVLAMIEKAKQGVADLVKATPFPIDVKSEMVTYAAELINEENKNLPRSRLVVACYGDPDEARYIRQIALETRIATSAMIGAIDELQRFLAGDVDTLSLPAKLDLNWSSNLSSAVTLMLTNQPAGNYVAQKVKPELFERPPVVIVEKYEYLLDAYVKAADSLRKIRKVNLADDPALADQVTGIITMLNEGYEVLGRLVDFFSRVRYTQLVVLGQHYKYQNRKYTITWDYVMENAVSEGTRMAMEKIHKKVSEGLRQYAI